MSGLAIVPLGPVDAEALAAVADALERESGLLRTISPNKRSDIASAFHAAQP